MDPLGLVSCLMILIGTYVHWSSIFDIRTSSFNLAVLAISASILWCTVAATTAFVTLAEASSFWIAGGSTQFTDPIALKGTLNGAGFRSRMKGVDPL